MAKPILDESLWILIEPVLPPPKPRRKKYPGRKPISNRQALTGIDGHFIRLKDRHSVGVSAAGVGLRFRDDVQATPARLAGTRCLGQAAPVGLKPFAGARRIGLVPRDCRFVFSARGRRGKKTGPSPVDRRKAGSKHHLLTDGKGVPLSIVLTGANRNDITELLPLLDGVQPVNGKIGRPRQLPEVVQGDRAYDSQPHRQELRRRGIRPLLAKRRVPHGSGQGKTRWPVERTFAWLHNLRRVRVRYERRADIHEAFLKLACAIICHDCLIRSFC